MKPKRKTAPTSLYETIGCQKGASIATAKKAIKHMILRTHPDKHPDVADEQTKEYLNRCVDCVLEIRKILCDPVRRRLYNYLLRKGELPRHGGLRTDFKALNQKMNEVIEDADIDVWFKTT